MKLFRVIDTETEKVISEGYAYELEVSGVPIPENTVRNNARYGKLYYERYQIVEIGNDGKRPKKKLTKLALGMEESDSEIKKRKAKSKKKKDSGLNGLEKDNEKARELGLSYGNYKKHEQIGDLEEYAELHRKGIA